MTDSIHDWLALKFVAKRDRARDMLRQIIGMERTERHADALDADLDRVQARIDSPATRDTDGWKETRRRLKDSRKRLDHDDRDRQAGLMLALDDILFDGLPPLSITVPPRLTMVVYRMDYVPDVDGDQPQWRVIRESAAGDDYMRMDLGASLPVGMPKAVYFEMYERVDGDWVRAR